MKRNEIEIPYPQVFELGQSFQLFDPDRTYSIDGGIIESVICLRTLRVSILPMDIFAYPNEGEFKVRNLTPFDPDVGYPITKEDYDWRTRRDKLLRLRPYRDEGSLESSRSGQQSSFRSYNLINSQKAPLSLSVESYYTGHTIYKKVLKTYFSRLRYTKRLLESLLNLRLRLTFPLGTYIGKIAEDAFPDKVIMFPEFYPAKEGPLALPQDRSSGIHLNAREGLGIMLPSDLERLAQIHGCFFLTETTEQLPANVLRFPSLR